MGELSRPELLRVVDLLEERHGVGVRGTELPRWLEERLINAVGALMQSRGIGPGALLTLLDAQPEAVLELANALRVGETRFYRDAAQWEALRRQLIPALLQDRSEAQPLVALSAGSSTGEEAWTLAMLLAEAAPRLAGGRARARVVGVDRSEPALVTARAGIYDEGSALHVPRELAQRFLRPAVDGSLQVVDELRQVVTFQNRDLTRGVPAGRYELIVCKNVLIYFGDEAQERLVADLLRALSDDGTLIVARSEVPIVRALGAQAREIGPGVTAFRAA